MWWRKPGGHKSRKKMISEKKKSVILTLSCLKKSVSSSLPIYIGYINGYIFLLSYIYFFPALFVIPMHFVLVFIGFVFGVVLLSARIVSFFLLDKCFQKLALQAQDFFFFFFFFLFSFFFFLFLFILWVLLQLLFSKIIAVVMGS